MLDKRTDRIRITRDSPSERRPALHLWAGIVLLGLAARSIGRAADWPTYQGNAERNATTSERLSLPLSLTWVHEPRVAPEPTWPPPAHQDFWHRETNLASRVDFDLAYHVAVAGDALVYSSPAEHAVHCLDIATGGVRWSFFAEGPVRMAPTIDGDKLYFGADDGNVYCLRLVDGQQVWTYRPSNVDRRLPGNGHMISMWPVRTGLVVEGTTVYGGAGLFPEHDVYVFALDTQTGVERWKRTISQPAQGYPAASDGRLWIPSGRTGVTAVRLEDGKDDGSIQSCGSYVVATRGYTICENSRYQRGLLIQGALSHPAHFVAIQGETAYFQGPRESCAVNLAPYVQAEVQLGALRARAKKISDELDKLGTRDKDRSARLRQDLDALRAPTAELEARLARTYVWRSRDTTAFSFLMAGDTLFCGHQDCVTAVRADSGDEIWRADVAGRAYSLAVAQGRLFVSTDGGQIYCFEPDAPATAHVAKSPDLQPVCPPSEFDGLYASAAEAIASQTGIRRGYALVLDFGEGRLARELAQRTDLRIVGVEADAAKAAAARRALGRAGLLGRVTVHHVPAGPLPYTKYFANLIVSDAAVVSGELPTDWSEIQRVLRPYGGVAMLGGPRLAPAAAAAQTLRQAELDGAKVVTEQGAWVTLQRGPLAGAGEWTHQYANPAGTASSGDVLVGGELDPLWFGEPGPREMIDRHNRTMAPLWKDGRMFVPANERVLALDAYNGTRLWELDVPGSRRLGVMKDAGFMAVADERLYVLVGDECWGVNVSTGQRESVFGLPSSLGGNGRWGYLAAVEDRIFGSIQKPEASYNRHGRLSPILEGDFRPIIVSDGLFCLDRGTGDTRWTYAGAIPNSTVALGNGRMYLLEARNLPANSDDGAGRIRIDRFFSGDVFLVALEADSGKKAWEVPVKFPYEHIVYLSYAPSIDAVVVTGTFNAKVGDATRVFYGLRTFRSATGEALWERDLAAGEPDGTHGEQWQYPVILENEILTKYYDVDLRTGESLPNRGFLTGHGCGTLSGAASAIFFRGSNARMFDLNSSSGFPINRVSRPGCFINIIPAGGMISIPESSAGCTCPYPLQASFAYVPADG